jgi:4-hydroxybutyrate CoA-transferase
MNHTNWKEKYISASESVKKIKSGNRVFIHSVAAAPQQLIKAMTDRADDLRDVEIFQIHTEGIAPYAAPGMEKSFRVSSLFTGANLREAVQSGRADFIPNFLSEIPYFFRKGIIPIDIALIHVSEPDTHGYCSLGVSIDVTYAAVESAKYIIAQVNPKMPRTFGDGVFHISRFDALVAVEDDILESKECIPSETDIKIGYHVAGLIEDGATLQMGIGNIPNAVLSALTSHKDLGIHSEMFSDGIVDLFNMGIITGKLKAKRPEKIVAGFVMGTRKVYDFIHDNPAIEMLDVAYVNDASIIRQNPKVTAINSAIEIDLTGQVCADSIGKKIFSGVGGQVDFIRGASLSEGGKPIIALPSQTRHGISRIVPQLTTGAGVVTTRAHVHYVVTEFGVAYLYGKSLRERARLMIDIAHPDHREWLAKEAGI